MCDDTRKALQEITRVSPRRLLCGIAYDGVKKVLDAVVLNTARLGEELLHMSQKTGMSVEALYALKNSAELNNVSLGELNIVIGALSRNIFKARKKAGHGQV